MTMAVVKGYYSQFLSYDEFCTLQSMTKLHGVTLNNNQEQKTFAEVNTGKVIHGQPLSKEDVEDIRQEKERLIALIKDEYTPSVEQQSSSVYEKPNYSQNDSSISIDDYNKNLNNFADINPEAKYQQYQNYLRIYNLFNVDLSACDLASSEYTVKLIQGEKGTLVSSREVNGEPKIYSLDKIYEATNPDTGILYKKVSSPVNEPVPEEVKELGDWYVEHWNEISVSYVSNESKIVSSEDEDLTREEQMKIYALKSAVLFQQLHANEKAGLKKEDYYIRDPLANTNGYKVATNPYINSLMWKL